MVGEKKVRNLKKLVYCFFLRLGTMFTFFWLPEIPATREFYNSNAIRWAIKSAHSLIENISFLLQTGNEFIIANNRHFRTAQKILTIKRVFFLLQTYFKSLFSIQSSYWSPFKGLLKTTVLENFIAIQIDFWSLFNMQLSCWSTDVWTNHILGSYISVTAHAKCAFYFSPYFVLCRSYYNNINYVQNQYQKYSHWNHAFV